MCRYLYTYCIKTYISKFYICEKNATIKMMDIKDSYNKWSSQYDSNQNKTRDLEGEVLRETLKDYQSENLLEIGCGTGKNTEWFVKNYAQVTSVDFSENMLAVAKAKVKSTNVKFIQADITNAWTFVKYKYDLISFSLVLEHIVDLNHVFKEALNAVKDSGFIYIGELHPFKQYTGSKARFETGEGAETVTSFTHHITEFINAANRYGFELKKMSEHFDEEDKNGLPRILTLLFQKK